MFSILSFCIAFSLFSFTPSSNIIEGEDIRIIDNSELIVSVETQEGVNFFEEAFYEAEKGDIRFITTSKVEQITVFKNEEKLVYVLPVKTKKIIIGKSLFNKGEYDLIFKVADIKKNYTTKLEVL